MLDTTNFDKFEEEEPWFFEQPNINPYKKADINFIGYTFKRDSENERSELINALENLEKTRYIPPTYHENIENYPQNNDLTLKSIKKPLNPTTKSPLNGNLQKALNNIKGDRAPLVNIYNRGASPLLMTKDTPKSKSPINNRVDIGKKPGYNSNFNMKLALNSMKSPNGIVKKPFN